MSPAPSGGDRGRIVVVTGASSGIGNATAEELGRRGFHVLAGVRKDEDAQRLDAVPGVEAVKVDVLDQEAIDALASRLEDAELAGLVNNAGVAVTGPVESVPIDEWRRQIEVNLIGQVAMTRALLPSIIRSQGRIVNVSSMGGRLVGALYGPYSASKFGLEAVTDALRREVGPLGVRVVSVEPGAVATPIWDKGAEGAEAIVRSMSDDARKRYGGLIESLRQSAKRNAKQGVPPSEVAEVIARALTARRPRTRYPVGRDARIGVKLARLLPDRALDAVTARLVGQRR